MDTSSNDYNNEELVLEFITLLLAIVIHNKYPSVYSIMSDIVYWCGKNPAIKNTNLEGDNLQIVFCLFVWVIIFISNFEMNRNDVSKGKNKGFCGGGEGEEDSVHIKPVITIVMANIYQFFPHSL